MDMKLLFLFRLFEIISNAIGTFCDVLSCHDLWPF